jgi:hypothetical protein
MLLALISTAIAQDCDSQALQAEVEAAAPASVARAYVALASCDGPAAKALASDAFAKALPGDDGNELVVTSIVVGAGDLARSWIEMLQSDERSRTIAGLGKACFDSEPVQGWIVDTHDTMGDDFWTDRWYRSLADCRVPVIQDLLHAEIENPSDNRTRFFGVLEVWARNLGGASVPTLQELATSITNEEELTYVVNAFADAAQVGSLAGQDAEVTAQAIVAINAIAPQLPPRAIEQARITLTSLGADSDADALVKYRYAHKAHEDGRLHWGVIAVEVATCKKGDTWLGVHTGSVHDAGTVWPDQIEAATDIALSAWDFELADKCKGTQGLEVFLPSEPQTAEELAAWTTERLRDLESRVAKKRVDTSEDPLALN